MKNQKGNVPAILVAVISVIIIAVAGILWYVIQENVNKDTTTNSVLNSINSDTKTTQSVFNEIQTRVAAGANITLDTNRTISNLPPDIINGQVGDVFLLEDILFVQIINRNTYFSVLPHDAELSWAGLLVSLDGGDSWQKYFSTFGGDVAHNVVGLYTKNEVLYIDVADAQGAGSGEGNLTRHLTINGGQTWSEENCYYLIPALYYTPSAAQRSGINPDGLEVSTSCVFDILSMDSATKNWPTYTNEELGFTFRYPPGTQVNWYPDAVLAGMNRVVAESNPNKDSGLYSDGVGPGSIGIGTYEFQSDLKTFAEDTFGGLLTAEPAEVAGISGFRVQGTLGPNDSRVLGALESITDIFYINYNAATWQFAFDAKVEFADQTPSHDEFLALLKTFRFTE